MKGNNTDRMFIAAMSLAIAGTLAGCNREQAVDTNDITPVVQADPAQTDAMMPDPAMPAAGTDAKMAMMDKNSDGMITVEEHDMGASSMFTSMDTDSNGMVSMAEMEAGKSAMGHDMDNMSTADKIKMIDGNGDGMISSDEHVTGTQAMFKKMDTDGNGSLSAAEMQAGHASMGG